jgi:hypothetical protein
VKLREYYDRTVWADEVKAQEHELSIVAVWDQLIQPGDKYQVLTRLDLDELMVATEPEPQNMDWGIVLTRFGGSRTITADQWREALKTYQNEGYEIVETEFHQSEFRPPVDGKPAESVVAIVLHVIHRERNTRYIVRGDLEITWSKDLRGQPGRYAPTVIDARKVYILQRTGTPAFREERMERFAVDYSARRLPITIHPVMLQDLNRDLLPEVIVAGYNRVYWNRGNWQFDAVDLCTHPARLVNAAAIADFTGDGLLDLFCAVKNGWPQLFTGEKGGLFPKPPRELAIADDKLRNPVGLTAGDVDRDGDLDVFIGQNRTGYQTGEIPTPYFDANDSFPSYLLLNDGKGNFTDATISAGLGAKNKRRNFSCSFIDLDDDGDLDLLLTNDFAGNDLYLNDGKGGFTDASESLSPKSFAHGMSHTFGDYNVDGRLDFFTIGMSSTTARRLDKLQLGRDDFPEHNRHRMLMGYGNRMYLSDGQGGFQQAPFNDTVARTGWSWGSTTLDFDRDGDQDVYVVNGQTSGKTTMDYCTRYWCHDLYYAADDRPAEAIQDFFARLGPMFSGNAISWNGYEHNALLMNVSGQEFVNVGFLMDCASELDSRMTVSGDLDLDGKVDLIFEHADVRNRSANLHFLRNQWNHNHHWVGVHLNSTGAAPSPLGAKISVHLPGRRKLLQHNVTGHSVWTQHANTVHFGLGPVDRIESIEVTWPNGAKSVLAQPNVDQYHVAKP